MRKTLVPVEQGFYFYFLSVLFGWVMFQGSWLDGGQVWGRERPVYLSFLCSFHHIAIWALSLSTSCRRWGSMSITSYLNNQFWMVTRPFLGGNPEVMQGEFQQLRYVKNVDEYWVIATIVPIPFALLADTSCQILYRPADHITRLVEQEQGEQSWRSSVTIFKWDVCKGSPMNAGIKRGST